MGQKSEGEVKSLLASTGQSRTTGTVRPTELPLFRPGSGRPSPFSASDLNRLVDALNRLLSIRVQRTKDIDGVAWDAVGPIIMVSRDEQVIETVVKQLKLSKVRVKVCDSETGEVQEWELYGRRIS